MGQTRILTLDGVMMLVCVAAVVVAARVSEGKSGGENISPLNQNYWNCSAVSCDELTHARLCKGRLASGVQMR